MACAVRIVHLHTSACARVLLQTAHALKVCDITMLAQG